MQDSADSLKKQGEEVGTWGRIVKDRLDPVLQFSGQKILDIGCSKGTYITALKKAGFDAYGCDLLPDDNWTASEFIAANSLNLPFADQSFDTCTAFEILEHLEDPLSALKEMHRIAKKNIILSVPNCSENELLKDSGLTFYHWTDKTHLQYFTPETLTSLIEASGFKVEKLSPIIQISPDKLFLSTLHIPEPLCKILGNLTKRIPFRKRYFMSILAVANKPS